MVDGEICKTSKVHVMEQIIQMHQKPYGLPSSFCSNHLPKEEVTITLEDDDGREFNATYLGAWAAISTGWKGFSIAHNLSVGDRLAFMLVRPLKFKVHIFRSKDSSEADGYLNHLRSCSSYKEVNSEKVPRVSKTKTDRGCELGVGKPKSGKRKSEADDIISKAQKFEVLEHTKEVLLSIPIPSFEKIMLPSHVSGSFWLQLPSDFCNLHVPKKDVTVILESDNEKEYNVKYIQRRVAFSGGWRGFSLAHKLLTGDLLTFKLVKPLKFKVHIRRANDSNETGDTLNLLRSNSHIKQVNFEKDPEVSTLKVGKSCEDNVEISEGHCQKDENYRERTNHDINKPIPVLSDGGHFARSPTTSSEVGNIENFVIAVNGVPIKLPETILTKYHELCCSQNSYLHINLLKNCSSVLLSAGITSETVMVLSAAIISDIVNIADAVRASTLTTLLEKSTTWEQSLKTYKDLGVNVGFILDRLIQLEDLARRFKKCWEAKNKCIEAEENLQVLEARLLEEKERINRLDVELENLEPNGENLELTFENTANASW